MVKLHLGGEKKEFPLPIVVNIILSICEIIIYAKLRQQKVDSSLTKIGLMTNIGKLHTHCWRLLIAGVVKSSLLCASGLTQTIQIQ